MSKPDVILFDIDDTLYSSAECHKNALIEVLTEISKNHNIKIRQAKDLYISSKKSVKLCLGNTASSHSRLIYFQRMLEMLNITNVPALSVMYEDHYWSKYISLIKKNQKLIELFKLIKDNSIKIGIITDLTASIQFRKLIHLGISPFINAIVTSEESGQDKPNCTCFSLMDEKINPSRKHFIYWMIGDHIIKDLKGAKAELNAITFHMSNVKPQEDHDFINHTLSDITELFSYINK